MDHDRPLIVQADSSLLLETASSAFREAREALLGFAELVKSPEHVHTYRITPLSIWNARAAGWEGERIVETLQRFSRYPLPGNVVATIREQARRFGRLELRRLGEGLVLTADDAALAEELARTKGLALVLGTRLPPRSFRVDPGQRGRLKQLLIRLGWPVRDLAGYVDGERLALELRETTRGGEALALRDYQSEAAAAFHAAGSEAGGNGVVVLPCGAGKTMVAMAAMAELSCSTLVLTSSVTAARQWIAELLDKTSLAPEDVGEYSGERKEIRPITVTTYQILVWRPRGEARHPHLELFDARAWGLIVYDEVHLLPAEVFQITADLQARRRLGLTATLVREDGREEDVFALIGPKCADVPWKELERVGWIARAHCVEVRVPLQPDERMRYATAEERAKHRIAAENPAKIEVVEHILALHAGEPALLIGTYVEQVRELAERLDVPMLSGTSPQKRRDELFAAFRSGELRALAVTKIANFAVDLPDAALAIQISGSFGSRQEEAQRLGRLLRPKPGANQAHFYSLVTGDTKEAEFAMRRQLFLCEQGYAYDIVEAAELLDPLAAREVRP
ncbi:MAG TPA: DNA repair helicase XPB [Planctomycetota bacterium]|nr:DNA repair helicase XPB [Planctomycetota bacterium]